MPSTFSPSGYLPFMIFGPYSVAVFGTKQSNIFDCDAAALDGKAKSGKGGRAQLRRDEKASDDLKRTLDDNRGVGTIQAIVLDNRERQLAIAAEATRMKILQDQLKLLREFLEESTSDDEKNMYAEKIKQVKIALSEFIDFAKFRPAAPVNDSKSPAAFSTPRVGKPSGGEKGAGKRGRDDSDNSA